MHTTEALLLALAGLCAGVINTVVGSGTLVTFPTMLAFGFAPVSANISNTVGLVAGGVSGTWGYRAELTGQWRRLSLQLPAAVIGSITGAVLLLTLPAGSFKAIVPALIGLALVLVVVQPRIQRWVRARAEATGTVGGPLGRGRLTLLLIATFGTGVYGGYFGAAQGVLLIGIMGAILTEGMQRINAAKNLLALAANLVSALAYIILAPAQINWAAAGLIAAGSLIGGFGGAWVGKRLPPAALRGVIVVLGLIAIWRLVFG